MCSWYQICQSYIDESATHIPYGKHLSREGFLALVPKLALPLQLTLLLHKKEVVGSLVLAFVKSYKYSTMKNGVAILRPTFASSLLHFGTSSHVSRPLGRRHFCYLLASQLGLEMRKVLFLALDVYVPDIVYGRQGLYY